jgi:hypothetical protein
MKLVKIFMALVLVLAFSTGMSVAQEEQTVSDVGSVVNAGDVGTNKCLGPHSGDVSTECGGGSDHSCTVMIVYWG